MKNKEGKSPKKKALENGKEEVALFLAQRSARRREGLVPFSHPQTNNLLNGDMQRLRRFGGWNGVSVSKHYEDILREAREGGNVALQISSLKKCGDTFLKEAEHRLSGVEDLFLEGQENLRERVKDDYKRAIYAYNEAITLCEKLPKELKERKREPKNLTPKGLLLQRLEELEASYIQKVLRRKPLSEGVKIEVRRERLAQMRIEAEKKLNRGTKAQVILREITDKNRSLVQDLIKDCLKILGQPSFSYAIMSCGSMSREEMCLYSDVELVVLLKEDTPEHRKYFVRFMNLFWFKIMMVGEDGEIQGFRLDENNATIYQEFLSTPKEMAERMLLSKAHKEQGEKEVNVISDFLGVHAWVDGDQELISAYEQEVTDRLDQLEGGRKLRELRALQQLQNNLNDFKPKLGNERDTNPLFDVKKELYRLPSQIANKLCLYYGIKEKNTWRRLEALKNGGHLSEASCKNLCKLVEKIARLRLRVHAHYKTEKEEIWHPGLGQPEEEASKNLFELTLQDIEILEQIYEVLIPLHKAVETFCEECRERGHSAILKEHFLPDVKFVEQAEMHESQLEYDNARESYEQALSLKPADSRILSKLGNVLYRLGRYQEARQKYESALNIEREKQIENHPVVADILHNLGRIWNALGQEKKAVTAYYEPALTMMSNCYNENHSSLLDILIDLGNAKRALGREEEAIAHDKHIVNIYQAIHNIPLSNFDTEDFHSLMKQVKLIAKFIESKNPSDAPVTLNNLGSLLRSLDRGGKHCFDHRYRYVVKSLHKKALNIYQSEKGNKESQDPRIAETLEQLGEALCDFEECENALKCYEKVLGIYKKFYGENHSETARILNRKGEVLSRLFRNEEAVKSYESALRIYQAHSDYGRNHPRVAAILNNLGKAYYALGEYKKAIQNYYDLALDIYEKYHDEAPLPVAETLNHLGLAKSALGKYREAEGHCNRALEIYKTHYGESHPLVAETYNHLGRVFSEYGVINTAREHHKKALQIYRKFSGKFSSYVGETLNYLGEIWRECGNLEKAKEFHRQALVIYKGGWFGEQHPHVAETLHCLGVVWSASGEYEKANEYYKAACNIRMKRYGSEHPLVAETLCQLGNSWRALGKSVNARYYYNANGDYEKALEIRKARYGEDHFLVGEVLSGLGNSWYALWQSEKAEMCRKNAEKSCSEALTIYEKSSHYGKVHLWVGELYHQLGKISFERKDYGKAREFLERALEIYRGHPGYGRSHFLEVADVLNNLGLVKIALCKDSTVAIKEYFNPALELYVNYYNLSLAALQKCLSVETEQQQSLVKYEKVKEWREGALAVYETIPGKRREVEKICGEFKKWHGYLKKIRELEQMLHERRKLHGNMHTLVLRVLFDLGIEWSNLGEHKKAIEYFEQVLRVRKALYGDRPHADVGYTLHNLGANWSNLGEHKKAIEYYEQALQVRKALYGDSPHADVGNSLHNLGVSWSNLGEHKKAIEYYEQALQVRKALHGDSPHAAVGNTLNNLGFNWSNLGEHKKAIEYYEQALQVRKALYGDRPHAEVGNTLNNLGFNWSNLGEHKKAIEYYEQALQVRKALYGDSPHAEVGNTLNNLGVSWRNLGEHKKAIEYYEQALQVRKALYGDSPHAAVGYTLYNLGVSCSNLGEHKKAIEYYEQALQVRKALYGDSPHADVGYTLHNLGANWSNLGQHKKAIEYYEQALQVRKALYGDSPHAEVGNTLNNLGVSWDNLGEHKKAIEYYEQALQVRKALYGDRPHAGVGNSLYNLGVSWSKLGEHKKAIEYYEQALQVRKALYGDSPHAEVGDTLHNLGANWSNLGEHKKAIEYHEQALQVRKALYGDSPHADVGNSLHNLGWTLGFLGEYKKAIALLNEALQIHRDTKGENHYNYVNTLDSLAEVYNQSKDYAQALSVTEKALQIWEKVEKKENRLTHLLLHRLGRAYFGLGDFEKAWEYQQRALDLAEKFYPDKLHDDNGVILMELGNVLRSKNALQGSLSFLNRARKLFVSLYGEEHPYTVKCDYFLGQTYQALEEKDKALECYQKAYKIGQRFFDEEHPDLCKYRESLKALQQKEE